ncbi:hypothetical protein L873DRAFT_615877 [Choiromyces venosus 120613-1]|uniref:Uncharacterized protein n=1 Tax=Choiromyces venosus 120613-1 TaxID=1336337 RepID=A0A3N4J756_9PEZI|nr:hypothetical protein L873DRAFT_615877 [Choiromyces venosus 120613-1]
MLLLAGISGTDFLFCLKKSTPVRWVGLRIFPAGMPYHTIGYTLVLAWREALLPHSHCAHSNLLLPPQSQQRTLVQSPRLFTAFIPYHTRHPTHDSLPPKAWNLWEVIAPCNLQRMHSSTAVTGKGVWDGPGNIGYIYIYPTHP